MVGDRFTIMTTKFLCLTLEVLFGLSYQPQSQLFNVSLRRSLTKCTKRNIAKSLPALARAPGPSPSMTAPSFSADQGLVQRHGYSPVAICSPEMLLLLRWTTFHLLGHLLCHHLDQVRVVQVKGPERIFFLQVREDGVSPDFTMSQQPGPSQR
jgi:hypothetical protein